MLLSVDFEADRKALVPPGEVEAVVQGCLALLEQCASLQEERQRLLERRIILLEQRAGLLERLQAQHRKVQQFLHCSLLKPE